MSVVLKAIMSNIPGESRALATLAVSHNGQEYEWQAFIPEGMTDYQLFCTEIESRVKAEINSKEAQWAALTPKTREVTNPFTNEVTTYPIEKSEIVRPEIPDYYSKRRQEYPSLGDQMDALWKGGAEQAAMMQKIAAVKAKYPKA